MEISLPGRKFISRAQRRLSFSPKKHSCITKFLPRQPDMDTESITSPLEPPREVRSPFLNLPNSTPSRCLNFTPQKREGDCTNVRRNDQMLNFSESPASPIQSLPSNHAPSSTNDPAEDESIALARMLMEQEAMESYAMSADYLRHNQAEYSQEDLAALQAVIDEEEGIEDDNQDDQYEIMLRLGEALGDVKQERWAMVAKDHIASLESYKFVGSNVRNLDENDSRCKCLICQFNYEEREALRKLPCGHCFHKDCVDQWLSQKDCCPYCRQLIVQK